MLDDSKKQQLAVQLKTTAAEMSINLPNEQAAQLIDYLTMLLKWNKAYNLTAIRDPDEMLRKHIADSLSVLPWIVGQRFIDVGTGGGLPGIVLAIMLPNCSFTLLDSNGKKTRFLFQVKAELGLANVSVVNTRVEQFRPPEGFDGIISRAFSSLGQMHHWTQHLLAEGGRFFAMKGVYNQAEIDELPAGTSVICHELEIPGEEGERHLVIIEPQQQ
jgi:16S rRNA (guanine527-N7)-methyltransferase